jgi:Asp/Glu/hydantoin racemase
MKSSIYIDTTVVSCLTAWTSRDLIRAAQLRITHDWWTNHRERFDLYVSEIVVLECSAGDPSAARDRLNILASLPTLDLTMSATRVAEELVRQQAIPKVAARALLSGTARRFCGVLRENSREAG